MLKDLFKIIIVTETFRNKPILIIHNPWDIYQPVTSVHDKPAFLFTERGDRTTSWRLAGKHRPITGPRVFIDIATIVQSIPGHISERIPGVPVTVE